MEIDTNRLSLVEKRLHECEIILGKIRNNLKKNKRKCSGSSSVYYINPAIVADSQRYGTVLLGLMANKHDVPVKSIKALLIEALDVLESRSGDMVVLYKNNKKNYGSTKICAHLQEVSDSVHLFHRLLINVNSIYGR